MTSPFGNELERLREQYRKTRMQFIETHQKLRSLTSTATSSDGFVTIAVGPQGELTELKFNNEKYRDMAPKELAKTIQDTMKKARDGLANQLRDVLPPSPFGNLSMEDMTKPDFDWGNVMPEDVTEAPYMNTRASRRKEQEQFED